MDYLEKLKAVEKLGEDLIIIARRAYLLYSDETIDTGIRFEQDWATAKAKIELCRREVESEGDDAEG